MNDLPILIGEGLSDNQLKFINTYAVNYCNISQACIKADISRQTFYRWQADSDKFAQALDQAKEGLKDRVESEIHKHIFEDRNPVVLNKFAPSILKDRGYAEAKDINLSGGLNNDNEVVVTIVDGGEVADYEGQPEDN